MKPTLFSNGLVARIPILAFTILGIAALYKIWTGNNAEIPALLTSQHPLPQPPQSNKKQPSSLGSIENTTAIATMSLDEARELLAKARAITDMDQRSRECSDIMVRLCKAGRFDDAIKLLHDSPGQVRTFELAAIFSNSQIPLEKALTCISELPYAGDPMAALHMYISHFVEPKDLNRVLRDDQFNQLITHLSESNPSTLNYLLTGVLQKDLALADSVEARSDIQKLALELVERGTIDKEGLVQILCTDRNTDPWHKWELISQVEPLPGEKEKFGQDFEGIINKMVQSDATRALEDIIRTSEKHPSAALTYAVEKWGQADPLAARTWFDARTEALTTSQKDAIIQGFVKMAINNNELDSATSWAELLHDEEIRKKTVSGLRSSK